MLAPHHRCHSCLAVAAVSSVVALFWMGFPVVLAPAAPSPAPVVAAATPAPPPATTTTRVPPAVLNRSIDEVLARREFAWRERRAQTTDRDKPSWLRRFFRWVGERFERVQRWWRNLLPKRRVVMDEPSGSGLGLSLLALKPLAYTAGAILVLATLFYLVKAALEARRARGAQAGRAAPAAGGAAPAADLTDENLLASQLPEDDWLRLARELLARGERRLALRAFYLSTLALLAGRGLLGIARHKTNGDYLGEVRRRAQRNATDNLPVTFEHMVRGFERTWYGRHEAGEETVAALLTDREAISAELAVATPPPPPPPPMLTAS